MGNDNRVFVRQTGERDELDQSVSRYPILTRFIMGKYYTGEKYTMIMVGSHLPCLYGGMQAKVGCQARFYPRDEALINYQAGCKYVRFGTTWGFPSASFSYRVIDDHTIDFSRWDAGAEPVFFFNEGIDALSVGTPHGTYIIPSGAICSTGIDCSELITLETEHGISVTKAIKADYLEGGLNESARTSRKTIR